MGLFGKLFSKRANPELERYAERIRQDLEQLRRDSEKPWSADRAALSGSEIWEKLAELNAKYESETGRSGISVADTTDCGGAVFVKKGLTALIKKDDYCDLLELALGVYPTPNVSRPFNEDWLSEVAKYRGKPNSEELLHEKSLLLARFTVKNLGIAITIYNNELELNREENAPQLNFENKGELTAEQEASIRLEEAIIWYRVIYGFARRSLANYDLHCVMEDLNRTRTKLTIPQQKAMIERVRKSVQLFMDYFEGYLAFYLALQGITPYAICNTLADRGREYSSYREEWAPEVKGPMAGTLLWEATKHIGEPLGARGNAFFLFFAEFFFERLEQALIYELLTGRDKPNR